jgi:hypothetical protein
MEVAQNKADVRPFPPTPHAIREAIGLPGQPVDYVASRKSLSEFEMSRTTLWGLISFRSMRSHIPKRNEQSF